MQPSEGQAGVQLRSQTEALTFRPKVERRGRRIVRTGNRQRRKQRIVGQIAHPRSIELPACGVVHSRQRTQLDRIAFAAHERLGATPPCNAGGRHHVDPQSDERALRQHDGNRTATLARGEFHARCSVGLQHPHGHDIRSTVDPAETVGSEIVNERPRQFLACLRRTHHDLPHLGRLGRRERDVEQRHDRPEMQRHDRRLGRDSLFGRSQIEQRRIEEAVAALLHRRERRLHGTVSRYFKIGSVRRRKGVEIVQTFAPLLQIPRAERGRNGKFVGTRQHIAPHGGRSLRASDRHGVAVAPIDRHLSVGGIARYSARGIAAPPFETNRPTGVGTEIDIDRITGTSRGRDRQPEQRKSNYSVSHINPNR